MSNQVTQAVTEEAAYQLFKNLFRFKDFDAVKSGLQRAMEHRFEEAAEISQGDEPAAVKNEAQSMRDISNRLVKIIASH